MECGQVLNIWIKADLGHRDYDYTFAFIKYGSLDECRKAIDTFNGYRLSTGETIAVSMERSNSRGLEVHKEDITAVSSSSSSPSEGSDRCSDDSAYCSDSVTGSSSSSQSPRHDDPAPDQTSEKHPAGNLATHPAADDEQVLATIPVATAAMLSQARTLLEQTDVLLEAKADWPIMETDFDATTLIAQTGAIIAQAEKLVRNTDTLLRQNTDTLLRQNTASDYAFHFYNDLIRQANLSQSTHDSGQASQHQAGF